MDTHASVSNEASDTPATAEAPDADAPHDASFWSAKPTRGPQDWVGFLGMEATDDEAGDHAANSRAMTQELVSLTQSPAPTAAVVPDADGAPVPPDQDFEFLTAPSDDLLPNW